MTDAITIRSNGKAEYAGLVGTNAWHGLGHELREGATIEEWTVESGLDWKVNRSRVRYGEGAGQRTFDEQHVLFRSDTKAPLAVVSERFKIVQPKQVLEFFRDLCEINGFKLRTAGSLHGGKRFWALADIGEQSFVLDPKDRVKGRVLLVTSCDGTLATTGKYVGECVVCANTLAIALGEDGKQVRVSHRSVFDASTVKSGLGLADGQFSAFIGELRNLAQRKLSLTEADSLTVKLFNNGIVPATEVEVDAVRASRGYKKVADLFSGAAIGSDLKGRSGTAYAWLNAITEYADHRIGARSVDNRFNSSQFGAGNALKDAALELAVATL